MTKVSADAHDLRCLVLDLTECQQRDQQSPFFAPVQRQRLLILGVDRGLY